jgi:hypothetical protein
MTSLASNAVNEILTSKSVYLAIAFFLSAPVDVEGVKPTLGTTVTRAKHSQNDVVVPIESNSEGHNFIGFQQIKPCLAKHVVHPMGNHGSKGSGCQC